MTITPCSSGGYQLLTEFWTPRPLDEVFPFFADAFNLQILTPEFLNFRVVTQLDRYACRTTIDYQIRLHGIPIGWKSLISAWEPPFDSSMSRSAAPYKFWHHEHTFEVRDGGTLIRDDVHYGVPEGGWLTPCSSVEIWQPSSSTEPKKCRPSSVATKSDRQLCASLANEAWRLRFSSLNFATD